MAEGMTREEYESMHDIKIVETREGDEPDERFALVRNSDGFGTAVQFREPGYGWQEIEHEDVIWFIDEATAHRDFTGDVTLTETGCDVCGRTMDADVAKQSPEGNLLVCPGCWVCGGDLDAVASGGGA